MTHELYLIRHGVAEERGPEWPDDTKRPLTDAGMSRLRKAARGLRRMGIGFDLILTSPLVRAAQTAEILAAAVEPRCHVATTAALAPGAAWATLASELGRHSRRPRLALVGHEPDLGAIAGRLLGSRHPVPFKKGAILRIDVGALPPADPGDLCWFLTPKLLRGLR